MTANVETMMFAGSSPWHGLGTRVPADVTSEEAIIAGGLDWTVELRPVFAAPPTLDAPTSAIDGCRAVVRTTDGAALGVVGSRYVPVQNDQAFAFFDSVVGEKAAMYHTCGALDGGRRVWLLAKLPDVIRVGRGDVTEQFLLLTNSHDGSTTLRMLFTPVRVVCQNTLNLALRQGASDGISIRHTRSATQRIDEAHRALGIAQAYYADFAAEAARLAATRYSDAHMQQLAEALFPTSVGEPSTRAMRAREKVVQLFDGGRGHEAIRGTAWAALNAVAEYADHERPLRVGGERTVQEARVSSIWFGSAVALKQRAYATIEQQLAA